MATLRSLLMRVMSFMVSLRQQHHSRGFVEEKEFSFFIYKLASET